MDWLPIAIVGVVFLFLLVGFAYSDPQMSPGLSVVVTLGGLVLLCGAGAALSLLV